MYTPLVTKNRGASPRHINTMMPKKGINREGLPQVMDTNFALKIKNYIPHDYGKDARRYSKERELIRLPYMKSSRRMFGYLGIQQRLKPITLQPERSPQSKMTSVPTTDLMAQDTETISLFVTE